MHIDFKVLTWYRVDIPKEYKEEVEKLLKEKKITCANDLCSILDADFEWYELIEAQEDLLPQDNFGAATMEAYSDDGHLICTNE